MKTKQWLKGTAVLGAGFLLAACGSDKANNEAPESAEDSKAAGEATLLVGASNVPHAEILEFVAPILKEEGIVLEIERYTDYVVPNIALDQGDLDANYFQHVPFFEEVVAEKGYDFVNAGGIHIEPIAAYSARHDQLADLPQNARILVSSNAPDYGRVLAILEEADLLTVKEDVELTSASFDDIAENPLNLRFEYEYDPALMPTLLQQDEGDVVFINSNFAVDHGLHPLEDSLAVESLSSPYANLVAVRAEDKDNPSIVRLIEVLRAKETQDFITENWEGAVLPVTE